MGVGIDGQFVAYFEIGGKSDFLTDADLEEFTIIEKAGNVLPEFIFDFQSHDSDIIRLLNEANKIKVKVGQDSNSLSDIELSITKIKTPPSGAEMRYYETTGLISNLNYITDHNMNITEKISGIEAAIKAIDPIYFRTSGNLTKSLDSQRWIQYSISDKAFINNCIMHCDLGDSFPAFAITAEKEFILKDVLKDIKRTGPTPYDWKLTKHAQGPKDIEYDSETLITSDAGLINNWVGYGRLLNEIDIESDSINTIFAEPRAVLAMTNNVDKDPSIDPRFGGSRIMNSNCHANYWKSYNHNLVSLVNLGKLEVVVHISSKNVKIKPLDLIMFTEESNESITLVDEYTSGLYICTGVIRTIQAKRVVTTILLNRETFNSIKVDV